MVLQRFAVELSMFFRTSDDQSNPRRMSFHHNIDSLGLSETGYRRHQSLHDMLHRVEIIVMEQNAVARRVFPDC